MQSYQSPLGRLDPAYITGLIDRLRTLDTTDGEQIFAFHDALQIIDHAPLLSEKCGVFMDAWYTSLLDTSIEFFDFAEDVEICQLLEDRAKEPSTFERVDDYRAGSCRRAADMLHELRSFVSASRDLCADLKSAGAICASGGIDTRVLLDESVISRAVRLMLDGIAMAATPPGSRDHRVVVCSVPGSGPISSGAAATFDARIFLTDEWLPTAGRIDYHSGWECLVLADDVRGSETSVVLRSICALRGVGLKVKQVVTFVGPDVTAESVEDVKVCSCFIESEVRGLVLAGVSPQTHDG